MIGSQTKVVALAVVLGLIDHSYRRIHDARDGVIYERTTVER